MPLHSTLSQGNCFLTRPPVVGFFVAFNLTATSDLVGFLTQLVIIEVVGSLTRAESA